MPPPDPPNVNDGLMITGRPIFFNAFLAFFIDVTIFDFGKSISISFMHFLNFSLSSAFEMAVELAPINSNPATIMTDPEVADKTYIEPINIKILESIIKKEKPCAILPTMGG